MKLFYRRSENRHTTESVRPTEKLKKPSWPCAESFFHAPRLPGRYEDPYAEKSSGLAPSFPGFFSALPSCQSPERALDAEWLQSRGPFASLLSEPLAAFRIHRGISSNLNARRDYPPVDRRVLSPAARASRFQCSHIRAPHGFRSQNTWCEEQYRDRKDAKIRCIRADAS